MAHFSPDDVLPALHRNISFSDTPQGLGSGFLSVKNCATGEETYLRGFEYSLARMLDGRRTARELVQSAEALGLPLTMGDLEGFLKKLEDRHLIGEEPDPGGDGLSPWRKRDPWNQQTRSLFRSALRNGRAGKVEQALSTLDILLGDCPSAIEAVSLRRRLEEQRQSPQTTLPFRAVFAQAERNWKLNAEAAEPEPQRARIGSGRAGLLAGAIALVTAGLAAGAVLVPLPRTVHAQATLIPFSSPRISVPRDGVIAAVPVQIGQWVEKDTVLFTYDTREELAQLEAGVARLERLQNQLYSRLPKTTAARRARTRYQRAERLATFAQKQLEHVRGPSDEGGTARIKRAEAAVNRALLRLFAAHQALDGLVPPDQLAEVAAQRAQVFALQKQLLDVEIEVRAPEQGVLSALGIRPGEAVSQGLEIGQIDDTRRLRAKATLPPRELPAVARGLPALVLANGRATQSIVDRVDGTAVEILIDNAAQTFTPGPAEIQIRGKRLPLVK